MEHPDRKERRMSKLISCEKAYEVLTDYYHHKTDAQHEALREALELVPPTEPERKTGHWDYDGYCSECGGDPMDFIDTMGATYDAYIETPMPYCPHCGAKMEGKVDILDYIHKPIKERLKDREALLAKRSALERGKDE